jgi:hypothetical protein
MFKRNPDAIALVLIVCALLVPIGVARARQIRTADRTPQICVISQRDMVKTRMRATMASLKQCLHLRSHHHLTARSL